ncbi:helix-turn-helix transcriptional regulator [Streptomyces sp. NPDC001941]|uniref:helix-turn-helix domain-containing protein n=1 Tax=Streptomyces sp. NPDC001941 TaxID=3154659 RepID=UPI00331DD09A
MLMRTRLRSGITQQQLADLSTVSSRAIRNLEKGHVRHPRKETVQLLADALRIDGSTRTRLLTLAVDENSRHERREGHGFHEHPLGHVREPGLSGSALGQDAIPLASPASPAIPPGIRPGATPPESATAASGADAGAGTGTGREEEPAGGRGARTPAYEYKSVPLSEGADPGATDILNGAAREGWRLAAVDSGTAYLERRAG